MEPYIKSEWSTLGFDHSSSDNNNNVFPPVNHEGLHTSSFHSHQEKLSPETQPLSILPSSQLNVSKLPNSQLKVTRPWDLGFEFLHQYVTCIHSWLRNYCVSSVGRGIISFLFSPHTALTTALLVLWYWRVQKQRQIREESLRLLIRIVRERDEEIDKLMRQIAHMNKLFYGVGTLSPKTT